MQTNSPYPSAYPALGILDPTATLLATSTLLATPSIPHDFTCITLPPLSFLLLADRLAELYEITFPDHSEWLDEEVVNWKNEEDVGAVVERFLKRVNTLFPVHDDFWDVDLEVVEWRLWEIPIMTMGYDEWYDGWEDLKEPAPYLLHMCYSRRDEDHPDQLDEFEELYPQHQTPRYLEPHRLVETLRSMMLPQPLDALPDLIEMLNHSTGNVWLDVGEVSLAEGGGYPPWERENVEWLTEEWQEAKPVIDRIHRLLDWQNNSEEEIDDKLAAVRDALLDAYQQTVSCAAEPN